MDVPLLSHPTWEAPRRLQSLCGHFPPHSTPGQTAELPRHARCKAFKGCMPDIPVTLNGELSRVEYSPPPPFSMQTLFTPQQARADSRASTKCTLCSRLIVRYQNYALSVFYGPLVLAQHGPKQDGHSRCPKQAAFRNARLCRCPGQLLRYKGHACGVHT